MDRRIEHRERCHDDVVLFIQTARQAVSVLTRSRIRALVNHYGSEILAHPDMDIERKCYQHGRVSTCEHSIRVACTAVYLADRGRLWGKVDLRSLIRAALLHDFFLYDWHAWDGGAHRLHAFRHSRASLTNAIRDFTLNDIERDSIATHMFPLTPTPPHYLEGVIITISDKFNATVETCSPERFQVIAIHRRGIPGLNHSHIGRH